MAMDNPTIEKANDALIALSGGTRKPTLSLSGEKIRYRLHRVELTAAQEKAREEGLKEGNERRRLMPFGRSVWPLPSS